MELMIDISTMTLAQAKEYCRNYRKLHRLTHCEAIGTCELKIRNICCDWVHEWDFDRLTPDELEICRVLGAKWVSKDNYKETVAVNLWNQKPEVGDDGKLYRKGKIIADISDSLFPSVKQGDCINVEELLGGESDG